MQGRLISFFRFLFYTFVILAAGFISCLLAMRFAIRGSEVTVPDLMGRTIQEAAQLLSQTELNLKVEGYRFDDRIPGDRILMQSPSPKSKLKTNRTVRVYISLGAKRISVPDLRGESLRAGQITLLKRGLTFGVSAYLPSEVFDKEQVISQDPLPQMQLAQSPAVNLLISQGKPVRSYQMPDLVGMNLEEVRKGMESAGLSSGKITWQAIPGIERGTVLKQSVPPGLRLPEGDKIDLEVTR